MRYRPVLLVAVALCVASAGALRAQSQDPMAKLLAQWESTFNAGHYDATAALYTPDAIRYPPGADPQRGTDDIVADMQNYKGITIKLTVTGSKNDGGLGSGLGHVRAHGERRGREHDFPGWPVDERGGEGQGRVVEDLARHLELVGAGRGLLRRDRPHHLAEGSPGLRTIRHRPEARLRGRGGAAREALADRQAGGKLHGRRADPAGPPYATMCLSVYYHVAYGSWDLGARAARGLNRVPSSAALVRAARERRGTVRKRDGMDAMHSATDTERRKLVVFDVTEDVVELLEIADGRGFELPRDLLPPGLRAGDVLRVVARVERAGPAERVSGVDVG